MGLPEVSHPREDVVAGGVTFSVRGLTRLEALGLREVPEDVVEIDIYLLACGTDTPPEAARAWYTDAPAALVEPVTSAIARLSGMLEDDAGRPTETPSPAP